jgi:dipeptidyl aminopeptidase/acylaminoacyl peptidase
VRIHFHRSKSMNVSLLLLLVTALPVEAQQKVLTPDLIMTIRSVADVQVAPDGSRALFQISRPRTAGERPGGAVPELWIVPKAGGAPARFTTSPDGDRAAQWSPDGRTIAFLSRRPAADLTQIHLIPVNGGEATRLTSAENAVLAFRWSPDGRQIAYTVVDPKTKEEQEAERKGQDWVVADRNYKHVRLHAIEVATKQSHVVTTGAITVHDFDWSPDGQRLVIAAADTPAVDDSYMRRKLQTVPASGGAVTLVATTAGKLTHPRWSPDGKWIAWLGATALNDPFAGSVFVAPATGGAAENLTPGYEGSANWLAWRPGAPGTIVFTAIERQDTKAYALEMAGLTPRPAASQRTPLPMGNIAIASGLSFSRDGKVVGFAGDTATHPPDVFIIDGATAMKRVTTSNPQLDGVAVGQQEVVRWKAADGLDIEGVVVKPVGYRPGTRYPLVMQPHGGPEGADLNAWLGSYSRWGQMLAGRGYVTFYPNYRGSIGRGAKYSMADHRDLMGKEFTDMLSGIDHLVKIGLVDGDRVGVGGGSYGGYTTAWAVTYGSDRFKAGVMWMGISNWYSMTGTSDIFFENSTVHWDLPMYDNYPIYWERSPLAHIGKARTPTLIIHGGADPRVPIGQSQEMYTALKWKGVPVEFVTYPREGHGVGEAAHQIDFMNRVTGWFDTYLKKAGTSQP